MEKNFKHLYKKRVREKKQKKRANKVIVKHKLNWLENISIVISLWFMFYPYPFYNALLIACIFLPLFGMYLNGLNKASYVSLIEITVEKGVDIDFDMADFVSFPSMAILLRVLIDYDIEFWDHISGPLNTTMLILLIIFIFLYHTNNYPQTRKFWVYTSIIVNLSVYVFSTTFAVNAAFDSSEAIEYKTEVIKKWISDGDIKYYNIKVKPWIHESEAINIMISKSDYSKLQEKSLVYIYSFEGLLNIPWYHYSVKSRYSLTKK